MASKNLTEAINRIDTIEQGLNVQRKNLSEILTSKGNPSQATEKLSVLINRVNEVETGVQNEIPQIFELKQVEGSIKKDTFKISWKIQDKETPHMVKQYLMLNGEKRDITNVIGFDKELYEYQIEGLQPNTEYNIQIIAFDGLSEGSSEIIPMSTTNVMPIFSNIVLTPTSDSIKIDYHVEDAEYPIEKHYIKVDNNDLQEITYSDPNSKDFTYILSGLSKNTSYSIQLIVELRGFRKESEIQTIKTLNIVIYGIRVMENNSNPNTSVTYIEGAAGLTPAKGSNDNGWMSRSIFNKIKQCGLKNGKVFKYINPKDETKYTDGTTVNNDVDVMTEFPKFWWKFTPISNGYEIRISDGKPDDGYICPAHTIGTKEVDNIYISCYEGSNIGGKLRSVRGQSPLVSTSYTQFRNLAKANGNGYWQQCYYPNTMLQILYMIMYKNKDSQSALGYGYANGNSGRRNTGSLLTSGMLYGETTGKKPVKFLGIEDWYGNVWDWVDGLYTPSRRLMISKQNDFNDSGSGYENCGNFPSDLSNYLSKVQAGNKTCFIPKKVSGASQTTHYCDYARLYGGRIARFGGGWAYGLNAGAFHLDVSSSPSSSYSSIGGRLVYLGY